MKLDENPKYKPQESIKSDFSFEHTFTEYNVTAMGYTRPGAHIDSADIYFHCPSNPVIEEYPIYVAGFRLPSRSTVRLRQYLPFAKFIETLWHGFLRIMEAVLPHRQNPFDVDPITGYRRVLDVAYHGSVESMLRAGVFSTESPMYSFLPIRETEALPERVITSAQAEYVLATYEVFF